jgi:outer membrane protein assembly factor BamB
VTYVVGDRYDERRAEEQMRSLGLGVQPSVLWTLDTRAVASEPGQVLLSLPQLYPGPLGGKLVDTPTHLVAAVGRSPDTGGGIVPTEVTLVGVDRTTGRPSWRRPVGVAAACATDSPAVTIACWAPDHLVVVDTSTGRVRGEARPDFAVAGARIVGGSVYMFGTRGNGPSALPVLASGTVDAPVSRSVRSIPGAGVGAQVVEVDPRRNAVITAATTDSGVDVRSTVFTLDSLARRWTFDGNVETIGADLFRAESLTRRTEALVDGDGRTVVTQRLSLAGGSLSPRVLDAPFVPVVMGDGAFDPRTGALLWRDPSLDWGTGVGGRATAVVGNVVVAGSAAEGVLIGLDARTGRRNWTTPWRDTFSLRTGTTDGRFFVFGDSGGMASVDTVTGRIRWVVDSPGTDVEQRFTNVSGSAGDIVRETRDSVSVWRARRGA